MQERIMIPFETTITAVTVFNDQARITRTGTATLEAGEHTLILANMPLSLIHDSVRAKGTGDGVTLLGVDVKTEYLADLPEEEIVALEDQLEGLREQDTILEDEDRVLAQRLEWLNGIAENSHESFMRALSNGRTSLDHLSALSDYIAGGTLDTQDRRRAIRAERRDLAKHIHATERELEQARGSRTTTRYAIHVGVQAESETEIALEVEYGVWNAGWQSVYDLRLEGDDLALTYMANVTQHTGEDWPEVSLLLSTARPGAGAALPELQPWYVWEQQRQMVARGIPGVAPQPKARAMQARLEKLDEQEEDGRLYSYDLLPVDAPAAAPEPQPMQQAMATIEPPSSSAGGGAVTYRIARPVEVPSDGTPHHTTIAITPLKVALDHITVPKLAEEAYLRATVTNTSDFILLPGQVSLFHGADFVGKTWIKTVAPGEEFKAQLGVDDRIRVERKLIGRTVSKAGLSGARRTEFAYRIKLTNLLDRPAKITVQDQIPLGRHEAIKAKLLNDTPQVSDQSKLNVLTWEMEIPRGEKREIVFTFSVEHPKDMVVMGLGE
jgi:uncharacterized protein (TIGR02231 family)